MFAGPCTQPSGWSHWLHEWAGVHVTTATDMKVACRAGILPQESLMSQNGRHSDEPAIVNIPLGTAESLFIKWTKRKVWRGCVHVRSACWTIGVRIKKRQDIIHNSGRVRRRGGSET